HLRHDDAADAVHLRAVLLDGNGAACVPAAAVLEPGAACGGSGAGCGDSRLYLAGQSALRLLLRAGAAVLRPVGVSPLSVPADLTVMIELSNVTKSYWQLGFSRYYVLRNLSLQLPSRTHVGIVGRNGAGKSTLLRLIGGIEL